MPAPTDKGIPQRGDRSAWDTHNYADLHASDIEEEESLRHLPLPGAAGGVVRSDGNYWQRINALDHSELTNVTADQHHARAHLLDSASDHSDVDSADKADGYVLVWRDVAGKHVYEEAGTGGPGLGMAGYAETIGDGVETVYTVTHSLNSYDVIVQVYDLDATPTEQVGATVEIVDADTVQVTFLDAPAVDQYRVLVITADVALPHDAVTLAASADVLLSLTEQELSLDTQTANTVLAGPASGEAAAPTFRALVEADLPAHDIVGADHSVTGSALDVVGLTGADTLGLLTPSANPGAASAILKTDASGILQVERLGVGQAPSNTFDVDGNMGVSGVLFGASNGQFGGVVSADTSLIVERDNASAIGDPRLFLQRIKDGGNVASGDHLGGAHFQGEYSSTYETGAIIQAVVDGTPGTDDMPTRLEFIVAADGAEASPLDAPVMVIDPAQNVGIGTDAPDAAYKLDVTGDVLLTGGLNIGTATGAGAGEVKLSASIKQSIAVGARVYRNTDQSIPDNTMTAVSFSTARFDDSAGEGAHWSAGASTRLTCRVAGVYMISAHGRFYATGAGTRIYSIRLNGTTVIAREGHPGSTVSNVDSSIATIYKLGVDDYVEFVVYQNSGDALLLNYVAQFTPELAMARIA